MEDDARWMARLLAASIQASGLSERELERRLGWRKGSLRKILQSSAGVEHQQALEILGALSGERVFADLQNEGAGGVQSLLERFRRLGYGPEPEPSPAAHWSGPELESRVAEILREAFGAGLEREEVEDE
jgi:hypothetical protein